MQLKLPLDSHLFMQKYNFRFLFTIVFVENIATDIKCHILVRILHEIFLIRPDQPAIELLYFCDKLRNGNSISISLSELCGR